MKSYNCLPEDYKKIFSLNLQKDKKTALLVNSMALVIAAIFGIPMHFFVPITTLFDMQNGITQYMLRFLCLIIATVVYMILHELIHGLTMKLCGTKKIKYGFTGMYAFAGSDDYYAKGSYIVIALAPVIFLGIVIALINAFVPQEWFWVVYFIQLSNISGAAGDLYVTAKFSKLPKDILINDTGVVMTVYSKQKGKIYEKA